MKRQLRGTVAFAVCGSFCTLGAAVAQAEQLVRQGWELLPVMSYAASGLNTRFGRADEWKDRLETLTCLLYTSPSPRDRQKSRMPSSA